MVISFSVLENKNQNSPGLFVLETPHDVSVGETTSTTVVPTTSLNRDEANRLICERARSFIEEAALVESEAGPGPVARGTFRPVIRLRRRVRRPVSSRRRIAARSGVDPWFES